MIISLPFQLRLAALCRLADAEHKQAAADHLEVVYGPRILEALVLRREARADIKAAGELYAIADLCDHPSEPAA